MKITHYIQLFAFASCLLLFSSCSNEAELIILDSEVDRLTAFTNEANLIAQQYEDLAGPKGSEIFGNNKSAVCGNEHVFIGPCIWAIDDIVEELGYSDIIKINQWFLETGELLHDLKKKNSEFENQTEFVTEIACLVAPEIRARSQTNSCYKTNLVALLKGALDGGRSHTANYYNNREIPKDEMYVVGSSFYKIWRYMVNSDKCK